jgi:fructose-bisphosphate aldolase class 1
MPIKIIDKKLTETELREIAKDFYVDMIKGVVDIERGVLAIGGEYHMDANMILIENNSKQKNIWGFNWYFDRAGDERIEYISLINIRPAQGNRTMEVQDAFLRNAMKVVILKYLS